MEKDSTNGDSLDSTNNDSQKKADSPIEEQLPPSKASNTNDAVRLKCRELIEKSLSIEREYFMFLITHR